MPSYKRRENGRPEETSVGVEGSGSNRIVTITQGKTQTIYGIHYIKKALGHWETAEGMRPELPKGLGQFNNKTQIHSVIWIGGRPFYAVHTVGGKLVSLEPKKPDEVNDFPALTAELKERLASAIGSDNKTRQ